MIRVFTNKKHKKNTRHQKVSKAQRQFYTVFFFHDKILHAQNYQKKTRHQKALKVQKHNQTKAQKRKKVNKNLKRA